ncbi:MAG TPA: hypothetical protein VIE65_06520 [Methylobacter sp.]
MKEEINVFESPPTETPTKTHSEKTVKIEPTSSQLEILNFIGLNGGRVLEGTLIEQSTESQVKTEYDLGELVRTKLLDREYISNGNFGYDITHKGRSCLVDHGLV